MKSIIIIFSTIAVLLTACNVKEQSNKDVLINEITTLNESLIDTVNFYLNIDTAKVLITKYENFIKEYENDSLTPIYLLKVADLSISTKEYNKAISFYETVYNKYSDYKKAPQALFLQAMIYADFLKNESAAKIKYKEFIDKYPNHELTDDAKKSIEFIGKTPAEILEIIQSKDSLSIN